MGVKTNVTNTWASWHTHVLLELERLAVMETTQNENIDELKNRLTTLESKVKMQSKILACVASTAMASVISIVTGITIWAIQHHWG